MRYYYTVIDNVTGEMVSYWNEELQYAYWIDEGDHNSLDDSAKFATREKAESVAETVTHTFCGAGDNPEIDFKIVQVEDPYTDSEKLGYLLDLVMDAANRTEEASRILAAYCEMLGE